MHPGGSAKRLPMRVASPPLRQRVRYAFDDVPLCDHFDGAEPALRSAVRSARRSSWNVGGLGYSTIACRRVSSTVEGRAGALGNGMIGTCAVSYEEAAVRIGVLSLAFCC
jgi:hypothetical protein